MQGISFVPREKQPISPATTPEYHLSKKEVGVQKQLRGLPISNHFHMFRNLVMEKSNKGDIPKNNEDSYHTENLY